MVEFTYDQGFTHGGKFHADDVFGTALLRILNPSIRIERGFTVPENYQGIVYDIGFNRGYRKFDHHQADKELRKDGTPYAAFGLLWREYGSLLLEDATARRKFEEKIVIPIDCSDNSKESDSLSAAISWMNAGFNEREKTEERFWKAEAMAETMIRSAIGRLQKEAEAKALVQKKIKNSDGNTLILDQFYPWRDGVKGSTITFVIFPSQRGGYNVCPVPEEENPGRMKIPFPEELGGRTQKELEKITGISGFTFCHVGGFIAATDSLESAEKVAEWVRNRRIEQSG